MTATASTPTATAHSTARRTVPVLVTAAVLTLLPTSTALARTLSPAEELSSSIRQPGRTIVTADPCITRQADPVLVRRIRTNRSEVRVPVRTAAPVVVDELTTQQPTDTATPVRDLPDHRIVTLRPRTPAATPTATTSTPCPSDTTPPVRTTPATPTPTTPPARTTDECGRILRDGLAGNDALCVVVVTRPDFTG